MPNALHFNDTEDPSIKQKLQFEYLKEWMSSVHHREIADVHCPFASLALGISLFKPINEETVRSILVESYRRLDPAQLEALTWEKLSEETSFFHMALYQDVEEVKRYWKWYLYCLTFTSAQFDRQNGSVPDFVVRMPLDFIDLQLLATYFGAKILVSRLEANALCFKPRSAHVMSLHLVQHGRRWAPLLKPKPRVKALENQLVTLQALEGTAFQSFRNKPAYVMPLQNNRWLPPNVYMVSVGQQRLPVERHQLHVIEGTELETWSEGTEFETFSARGESSWRSGSSKWQGPGPGEAPSFRGIADGSVEFQLLQQLLGDLVFRRMRQKRDELSGHEVDYRTGGVRSSREALPHHCWTTWTPGPMPQAPRAPQAPQAPQALQGPAPGPRVVQPRQFKTERRPLEEVIQVMKDRQARKLKETIRVRCPTSYAFDERWQRNGFKVSLERGMHLVLNKVVEHAKFTHLFSARVSGAEETSAAKGWFLPEVLCVWEVRYRLIIPQVRGGSQTVQFEAQESVTLKDLVCEEGSGWNGWVEVVEWSKSSVKRGFVDLQSVRGGQLYPYLLVGVGDLPQNSGSFPRDVAPPERVAAVMGAAEGEEMEV